MVRSSLDLDWGEPSGTSPKTSWGRILAWILVTVGLLGIGASYFGPRWLPRGDSDETLCRVRRMVLARGALCLNPPFGSEKPNIAEYLAYQDRIVGATLETVGEIPLGSVTTFLTRSILSDDSELSYRSITRGLSPVEDPLAAGPEIFVCPSGGEYGIHLYKIAGDPETLENPAPTYPGVTCSVHSGVVGGSMKESREILDRSMERQDAEKQMGEILSRGGLVGIGCALMGLVLLILGSVRQRRS